MKSFVELSFYWLLFYHVCYLLVVGCSSGEVGSREKVVTELFKIWDMAACSVIFQVALSS